MRPVRVCEVFDSLEMNGGVQSILMQMVRRVDRARVQIDFAVYDLPDQNSYAQEAKALGVSIHRIPNVSEAGIYGFYRALCAFFREHPYDVVHAHNLLHNGIILLAAKQCGVKRRISHSHQSFDGRNNTFPRNLFAIAFKKLGILTATDLVACSDLAAAFLFGKHPKYVFLPNALDSERYRLVRGDRKVRESFGVTSPRTHILAHIGRFAPDKNHAFLLEIMDRLRYDDCVLLLAGDGELKESVLEQVREKHLEEHIRYLGLIDTIPQLLSVADCLLLPSFYEGLPVVGVEAQAAGCCTLLSDTITRQADLGLGLVDYLSLSDSALWVERIRQRFASPPVTVSHDDIVQRLIQTGFESQSNLAIWLRLYGAAD